MITDNRDTCALKAAIDEHETCPGEPCPFWRGDECVIAGMHSDLATTAGLPELLLRIRERPRRALPALLRSCAAGSQVNGGSIFDRVVCGVDRSDAGIAAAQVAGRVAARSAR
jgi:hypothetical protein